MDPNFNISILEGMLAERQKSGLRVRFDDAVEARYRQSLRRQLRHTRTLMFALIALGFAAAPFHEGSVFGVPPALHGLMALTALLCAPLGLLASLFSALDRPRVLTQSLQSSAVVVFCASALVLRFFALRVGFAYPAAMVGVIVTAIAIFGSFSWYRLLLTAALSFTVAVAMELQLQASVVSAMPDLYVLFILAAISMLGAYNNETLRRQAWLQGECANLLARMDPLTGLANRADLDKRLPTTFAQAKRRQKPVVLAVIDIDHFKSINDRYGHAVGDQVLAAFGALLRNHAGRRPLDIVARSGGEEFIAVWYDMDTAGVSKLAEDFLADTRKLALSTPLGEKLGITASIGVTWLVPATPHDIPLVISYADGLMYRAKDNGRDQSAISPFMVRQV